MLFVPYPAFGHVNPMLPVIRELVSRGVRVRVVADQRLAAPVAEVGAQIVPLSVRSAVHVPARVADRVGWSVLALSRKWAVDRDAAALVARDRPSLVVVDPMMSGVDRVARRSGLATVVFSTTYAQGEPVPAWWRRDGSAAVGSRVVNRFRAVSRQIGRARLVLVNTIPELQPSRAELGTHVRFVGPLLRVEREFEMACHRPLLFVSPGTVFARRPEFFATVAHAFARTSWQVVMSTGAVDPNVLAPLPDNVVAARWVPQLAMLSRADVFFTHAGMNSALEAMAAGVPMVVAPRAGDQRFIARRLVELGMACRLPDPRPETLRAVVEYVAEDPVMRATANKWRERLAEADSAAAVADMLVEFERTRGACR